MGKIDFDEGFDNWMSSVIEYEMLTRPGKPISIILQRRLNKASNWLNNLSDRDYNRLIY